MKITKHRLRSIIREQILIEQNFRSDAEFIEGLRSTWNQIKSKVNLGDDPSPEDKGDAVTDLLATYEPELSTEFFNLTGPQQQDLIQRAFASKLGPGSHPW